MLTNGLCITVEGIGVCFLTVKDISLLFKDFSRTVGKRKRTKSQFRNCGLAVLINQPSKTQSLC